MNDMPKHWLDVMPEARAEVREYAEEFAKLAVREALQRLLDLEDDGMDLRGEARAMLKEYEG